MGKRRQPQERPPESVGDDITTTAPSEYDQGVAANKARNQSVLDALQAPQLERPQKRCGPKHFDPAAGPLYIYCRRTPLQAEATEAVYAATTDEGEHRRTSAMAQADSEAMILASGAGAAPTRPELPAVYLVPVAYWLQGVQFCASVHCQVDGTKAIGILSGTIEGQLELDFGEGMKRFPARTAEQWRVDDAAEAEKHRNDYAAACRIEDLTGGTSVVNNNTAEPQGPNDASSGTRTAAAPLRSAEARGDDRRQTYGSTHPNSVRGRARTTKTTARPPNSAATAAPSTSGFMN